MLEVLRNEDVKKKVEDFLSSETEFNCNIILDCEQVQFIRMNYPQISIAKMDHRPGECLFSCKLKKVS